MRAQQRLPLAAVAFVLVLLAVVAACSGLTSGRDDPAGQAVTPRAQSSTDRASATVPPAESPGLGRFYSQRLSWVRCRSFECARLMVPVDYEKPDGATIMLALLRAPARSGSPIGALVVNPGGPGASGVQYAAAADYIVSGAVRRNYDIVGFDPRGVGQSAPLTCMDDREFDAFLGSEPTPDTPAEQAALLAVVRGFAAACQQRGGELLGHVSTVEVARDMDVLRAALGQDKLDYLGKSYGTFLGATYADLFPARVGRLVIDGVMPGDLSFAELNLGQAKGFETATRAYVAHCVRSSSCPLGSSVDAGLQRLRDFLAEMDRAPLPLDDRYVERLTEAWAASGIGMAMYDEGLWEQLTAALRAAFRGDGDPLMALANQYAHRGSDGKYQDNLLQVIHAVNCLDRPEAGQPEHFAAEAERLAGEAPIWGRLLAWGSATCGVWPVTAGRTPEVLTAEGSDPILVVGTTGDPATPYEWAVRVAGQLANGHLVTYEGDGHTAYSRGNACIDATVDAFLLRGTVPRSDPRC